LVIVFAFLNDFHFDQYLFLAAYFPLSSHLLTVAKNRNPKLLDPELKKLALSTFFLAILLALSLIYFISDLLVNYI
jgi:1,4-dihydroxy-2-naphthoate octaprenyltransferase